MTEYHRMMPSKNFRWKTVQTTVYHGDNDRFASVKDELILQQLWVSNTGWRVEWREIETVFRNDEPDVVEGMVECKDYMQRYHT